MASKIRVGIVGASPNRGFASISHIPALQALPDFEIVAVCTSSQQSADAAAKHYGVPLAFADAAALAAHPDVDLVTVSVKVKNMGDRASDEVVQLYLQHLGSAVTRPRLELKGFKRVRIEAGSENTVTMELKARDLAYWDVAAHAWRVEKERVRLLAGGSSDSLPVNADLEISSTQTLGP